MRILAIVAMTAVIGACSGSIIKEEMKKLQGQPLSVVVSKLAVPTEEREIAGNKVYVWFNRTLTEGTELKCQIRVINGRTDSNPR